MPNLSIKNVPESVVERLRRRAEHNHRSLQGELMALVCGAVEAPPMAAPGAPRGTKPIEQIAQERRARRRKPIAKGPSAAQVIRSDRDAR
jgi:antitoxin FitA